jgi:hypothetical protein
MQTTVRRSRLAACITDTDGVLAALAATAAHGSAAMLMNGLVIRHKRIVAPGSSPAPLDAYARGSTWSAFNISLFAAGVRQSCRRRRARR